MGSRTVNKPNYIVMMLNTSGAFIALGDESGNPFVDAVTAETLAEAYVAASPYLLKYQIIPLQPFGLDT